MFAALVRRQPGDVGAFEEDRPAVRPKGAGDQVEQRGLAGAVRPDQADDLARFDLQIDDPDRRQSAERTRHLPQLEQHASAKTAPRSVPFGGQRGHPLNSPRDARMTRVPLRSTGLAPA